MTTTTLSIVPNYDSQKAQAEARVRIARRQRSRRERQWQRERNSLIVALVLATVLFGIMVFTYVQYANEQFAIYEYTETTNYTVRSGDTLWFIAGEFSDERHDVRQVVDDIEELSNTTAFLQVGQQLTIPLYDCLSE